MSTEPKQLRCTYKGRTEYIPEIWLAGRARYWSIHAPHLHVREQYQYAVEDWFYQSELAEQYEQQRKELSK